MVKLVALTKVLKPDENTAVETLIQKGKVFNATPDEAKQLDKIKAARPATAEEIAAAAAADAITDGSAFSAPAASGPQVIVETPLPESGAQNDPNSAPKGRAG